MTDGEIARENDWDEFPPLIWKDTKWEMMAKSGSETFHTTIKDLLTIERLLKSGHQYFY